MAVTPVRTGPLPISSLPSPEMSVVWPTSTPFTSVMALLGPGAPSKGTPRSRARGLVWADTLCADRLCGNMVVVRVMVRRNQLRSSCERDIGDLQQSWKYNGWEEDGSYAVWCAARG